MFTVNYVLTSELSHWMMESNETISSKRSLLVIRRDLVFVYALQLRPILLFSSIASLVSNSLYITSNAHSYASGWSDGNEAEFFKVGDK